MKVSCIVGSPRKAGNSSTIAADRSEEKIGATVLGFFPKGVAP